MSKRKVAVIGAGASGLMAAGFAAQAGADVTLFERNDRIGKKIVITGKGRCNLTNDCSAEEFMRNVPRNGKFLYTALSGFNPQDTQAFFEQLGCAVKVERGNRVFPVSDSSFDVVDALRNFCRNTGVHTIFAGVRQICDEDGAVKGVVTDKGNYFAADAVIVCTGGLSYPTTGSCGDGYTFARKLGHTVTSLKGSLVPLEIDGGFCRDCMGLTLKNVALTVVRADNGKQVYSDFGELLFTHFGLSGPMILSASAHINDAENIKYKIYVDLKPALDEKTLDARILSDFAKYPNRDAVNALSDLLPQKIIQPFVELWGVEPSMKVNSITKAQRIRLAQLLKRLEFDIAALRPVEEAVITSGGVDVKQINPRTMESKLISGLYFAGEVVDVDAYTGGFNLQIAFSTGRLAGLSAAAER